MAEASWVKVMTDMHNHPKLKQIDSMENNNLIHYVWISCILLAGKCNHGGDLYLTEDMPYTIKTLSVEFRKSAEEVKESFKVLRKLKMIELTEDRVFCIKNWEKYQNVDGLDKIRKQTNERVAKYREKKREEKRAAEEKKKSENKDIEQNNDDNSNNKIDNNSNDECKKEKVNVENNAVDDNEANNKDVTCNVNNNKVKQEQSVTETQQNKKESYKKNKKKSEKEENSVSNQNISQDVIELSEYCERISGVVSVLEIGALNLVVEMHGKDNVKRAIDKAIEVGKVNMPYISGILKNWRKEGYPNDDVGGNKYGGKCNNKSDESDSNKLKDFKPKEPRKLSEAERKRVSASVV